MTDAGIRCPKDTTMPMSYSPRGTVTGQSVTFSPPLWQYRLTAVDFFRDADTTPSFFISLLNLGQNCYRKLVLLRNSNTYWSVLDPLIHFTPPYLSAHPVCCSLCSACRLLAEKSSVPKNMMFHGGDSLWY